ncbi:MAG: glycoside hydrolase [Marinilabiliales bacterium]|nr:MAG: glycoside hydrolase [Marinilabiliales bacterium]
MSTTIHIKYLKSTLGIILFFCLVFASSSVKSENLREVVGLEGTWKFSVGDDLKWANYDYNDAEWDYVHVPKSWESNGFDDYNGYAWYRKKFQITYSVNNRSLFIVLGKIDDVDEVYFNGHLIGATGIFPPLVRTAYDVRRKYHIPEDIINYNGTNVVAVRVYDEYAGGGIVDGPIGIYNDEDNNLLSYDLSGYWNFEPSIKTFNNSNRIYGLEEGKMYVPAYWESYGFPLLDASATYSKSFIIPTGFNSADMMIVLGYIDDVEIVYFNDKVIGKTDDLINHDNRGLPKDILLSAYNIPSDLFVKGGSNTIMVKVYDTGGLGGIYEGPVGLITRSNFRQLKQRQTEKPYSIWNEIFKSFFE